MTDSGSTESLGTRRRRFLKLTGAGLGTLFAVGAGALGFRISENLNQQEGTPKPQEVRPVTIEQLLRESPDPQVAEAARKTAQEVYARADIEGGDWALIVSKPAAETALSFTLTGIQLTEAAKSKKGSSPGMEIIIQRKAETDPDQIMEDNQHPQADLVARVNGMGEAFYPVSPGYETDQLGWKGFGLVMMADGQQRPPLTVLGETAEQLILYMPVTSFMEAGFPPTATNFTANTIPITYPKR